MIIQIIVTINILYVLGSSYMVIIVFMDIPLLLGNPFNSCMFIPIVDR